MIEPYDLRWPLSFEAERHRLLSLLGDRAFDVQHIGSTAVPGLPAKPVIDIAIGLPNLAAAVPCIPILESAGYSYEPDFEAVLPERKFLWRVDTDGQRYHLNLAGILSPLWRNPIAFRDYLRGHPAAAREYGQLKEALAARCSPDIGAYIEGKAGFVARILASVAEGPHRLAPAAVLFSVTTGPERRRRLLTPIVLAIALACLGLVVLGSLVLDRSLALPALLPGAVGSGVGVVLLAAGLALWGWSLASFRGKGVPVNPPSHLVTTGLYAWVRNPMLLGLFGGLVGLGFLLHSVSLVFVGTPAFTILSLLELKLVEEPELRMRLGAAYAEYRKSVPMFIPRKPLHR